MADTSVLSCLRIGGALNYAGTLVKRNDGNGSNTSITNFQSAFYSSASYGPLFLEDLIFLGYNRYQGKRNILALGQTATARYSGTQYGVKVIGGFTIPFYEIEASPIASFQIIRLTQGRYTEQGAPGADLSVGSRRITGNEIGLGIRVVDMSQADDFLPEIHALYVTNDKSPSLQYTTSFVSGGGAFIAEGPVPTKHGVNVGVSLTALLSEYFLVMGAYDLKTKKSYTSHSASLKFKWLFD